MPWKPYELIWAHISRFSCRFMYYIPMYIYLSCIMFCGNKIVSNCFKIVSNLFNCFNTFFDGNLLCQKNNADSILFTLYIIIIIITNNNSMITNILLLLFILCSASARPLQRKILAKRLWPALLRGQPVEGH